MRGEEEVEEEGDYLSSRLILKAFEIIYLCSTKQRKDLVEWYLWTLSEVWASYIRQRFLFFRSTRGNVAVAHFHSSSSYCCLMVGCSADWLIRKGSRLELFTTDLLKIDVGKAWSEIVTSVTTNRQLIS